MVNSQLLNMSGGTLGIRPDIYIGNNKDRDDPGQGFTIRAEGLKNYNLSDPNTRIEIARNGFNVLNAARRDPVAKSIIERGQSNLSRGLNLYTPVVRRWLSL